MIIGNRHFKDSGRTYIMAILNVTPDSFYDGGTCGNVDAALRHVDMMVEDGADVIDIGGESTRPGYKPVDEEEELKRIIPVIKAVKDRYDIPVSADTFHSRVAYEALEYGADMINDIWGLKYAGNMRPMAEVAAHKNASVCIMHNSEKMYSVTDIGEVNEVNKIIADELQSSVRMAEDAGIDVNKIMIDPGIGFSKDYGVNMGIIANINMFHQMGYPVMLGASNKSVIGTALNLPVNERMEGTLATTAFAVMSGCSFVRVHDVKSNIRLIRMLEEIGRYRA